MDSHQKGPLLSSHTSRSQDVFGHMHEDRTEILLVPMANRACHALGAQQAVLTSESNRSEGRAPPGRTFICLTVPQVQI